MSETSYALGEHKRELDDHMIRLEIAAAFRRRRVFIDAEAGCLNRTIRANRHLNEDERRMIWLVLESAAERMESAARAFLPDTDTDTEAA